MLNLRNTGGVSALVAVCIAALSTLSCAQVSGHDSDALRDSVAKYWKAIQIFDLATAYRLEAGSREGRLTAGEFREFWGKTDWELSAFEIRSIDINKNTAEVDLMLTWSPPEIPKDVTRPFSERWRLLEDGWYRDAEMSKGNR
jgi:hypothetical protein